MSVAAPIIPGIVDKFEFFRMLGYEPHPVQRQVHLSKAPRRVLSCGVRWGKTKCAAMEACFAAVEPTAPRSTIRRGWVVAPTYDLADKVFREIVLIFAEHLKPLIIKMSESDRLLRVHNMGGGVTEIRGKTADNPVSLLGEGLDFCIVDEAAQLRPDVWERQLSARLIDRRGWAILISTPKGKGWYYQLWMRGQAGRDPLYRSWNLPTWTNPHIDRDEIRAVRKRVLEAIFRQEYGAEFIEGVGSVFRYVAEACTGSFHHPRPNKAHFGGLDVAKTTDFNVLSFLDEDGMCPWIDRFHRVPWGITQERVRAGDAKYQYAPILMDSTGMGEPVYDYFSSAGVNVQPYLLTNPSKTALINNLALCLEQRLLVLPKREVFPFAQDELEAFQYDVTNSGTVTMGAPSGFHDDVVISLALAAWQLAQRPYFFDIPA